MTMPDAVEELYHVDEVEGFQPEEDVDHFGRRMSMQAIEEVLDALDLHEVDLLDHPR